MMSNPATGSSGSSTDSDEMAPHLTGAGVKKTLVCTKKTGKEVQATEGESGRKERKWQAFFDSARQTSADNETVRARLFEVLKEVRAQKEAEKNAPNDFGECSGHDVKELMAKIYLDIDRVAAAQHSRAASEGAQTERVCLGELSERDVLLREVSIGVTEAISESLHLPLTSTVANCTTGSALAHLHIPECPQSDEACESDEKTTKCLSHAGPASERFGKLASHHGWKFLSKLAHSAVLLDAAHTLDAPAWQTLTASIDSNAVSLAVFVENCALAWWAELIRLNPLFPPTYDFSNCQPPRPKPPTPHKWVVTENLSDVHQPTFEGEVQINIHTNIYRASAFARSPRPPHWPPSHPYPADPTLVRTADLKACLHCRSHSPCACTSAFGPATRPPLVELRSYGAPKGVGVRALQRIPARAVLAEYVGELRPFDYAGDPVYGLDFSLPGAGGEAVLATVSAKRVGNWTRFVNHSCDASAVFRTAVWGGRVRVVVQTVREVAVFEELTVDYGSGYWRGRVCGCGVEGCVSKGEGEGEDGPEWWDLSTVGLNG